jgi:septal ring factor EnvC (AmiA/AmiB activator)
MTERIQHSMNEIRAKALEIHGELVQERIKNQALQAQILEKEQHLQSVKDSKSALEAVIDQLKLDLEVAKNQIVEVSVPQNGKNEEQIDELVKEIEYCIGQLKK